MKRLLVILALLFAGVTANAQSNAPAQTPEQAAQSRAHSHALYWQKMLNLSEAQTTQAEQIALERIQKIQAINADASKTSEAKQREVAQVKADSETKFQAVLSPEQFAKYREIKAQKQQRRAQNGGQEE